MTSPIGGVGAVPFVPPTGGTPTVNGPAATGFTDAVGKGLDALANAQSTADNLSVKAATGELTDISQYTVAAGKAQVMTEFAAAMRTKAIDAFNTVMGMQA